jgi:hypothetical protein
MLGSIEAAAPSDANLMYTRSIDNGNNQITVFVLLARSGVPKAKLKYVLVDTCLVFICQNVIAAALKFFLIIKIHL